MEQLYQQPMITLLQSKLHLAEALNAMISTNVLPRTNIRYCPMIEGSPTKYSTIYTVVKPIHAISASLR